jgi:hypothetical protein
MGAPGVLLALLAAQLEEPHRPRRPPASFAATLERWYVRGLRRAVRLALPLIGLSVAGAGLSGLLGLVADVPSQVETAVFAISVSAGIVWTVVRLVPLAVRRTTQATRVAESALEDFLEAAATVLRTPTLIWIFVGGALVTFAANGLIAWAPSFLVRVHGLSLAAVGKSFGVWALLGGATGGIVGGRIADWLLFRCVPRCCSRIACPPWRPSWSRRSSSIPGITGRSRPRSSTWCPPRCGRP